MHMRPLVSTPIRWLPALAVAWFALMAEAQRPPESRPATGIQFTEPKSSTVNTNQSKLTETLPDLRGLDAGVRKPFEVFNASDSFSGTMTPQPRRALPSAAETKRLRESLDRKKNWAFLTPEEIYGVQTPEEMLHMPEYGKDGEAVEPKTSLERYLERMEKSRVAAVSNQANSDVLTKFGGDDEAAEDDKAEREEKPVLSFLAESRGQLPGITPGAPGFNQPFINAGISMEKAPGSLFNTAQPAPTVDPFAKSSAQEASMKEFKQMLESRSPASAAFNPGFGVSAPPALAPIQPFSFGTPAPNPAGAQPSVRSPLTTPATFGVAVPSYTPAYSPPPTPAPTPRVKPAPTFELPARKF
jgi:hypothetical protein